MKVKVVLLSLLMTTGGTLGVGAIAQAGCNFHGCSQVSGVECNFHGCPIPPNGAECNFHGCPAPTQQQRQRPQQQQEPQQQQQGTVYVPVTVPQQTNNQSSQTNPEDIAKCIKSLLYEGVDYYGHPRRTEINEQAAIQACASGR